MGPKPEKIVNVLIVDEHKLVRTGIRRILDLEEQFYVTDDVGNCNEAIRSANLQQPDVVLMDSTSPCTAILDDIKIFLQKFPDVKMLVMCSGGDVTVAERLISTGIAGYLSKKCSVDDLLAAMRTVSAGQRCISHELIQQRSSHPLSSPFDSLSEREFQVLLLVSHGYDGLEISRRLSLSQKTVNSYRTRLRHKFGVRTEVALLHLVLRHGLIDIAS